jgi:hypothetical protein
MAKKSFYWRSSQLYWRKCNFIGENGLLIGELEIFARFFQLHKNAHHDGVHFSCSAAAVAAHED